VRASDRGFALRRMNSAPKSVRQFLRTVQYYYSQLSRFLPKKGKVSKPTLSPA
jgi:hypothetical protein